MWPTSTQSNQKSCITESTQHGCLTELILRAYEAYNTDPEHLFISLFQNLVESDVVAFSSSMGPKYLRGSSEVLEMLVKGRKLGKTMISMNDVFQSNMRVVTHFTMLVETMKPNTPAAETHNKVQGLAVFYFNTVGRIYQVHYALDSDTMKYAMGRTQKRNNIVTETINMKGFNDVVQGDETSSKPHPHIMLTLPERIRKYFDAWNTLPQNDLKFLEEEFDRFISKDIEVKDLTWGGKTLRNHKLVKKLFLENWRGEGKNLAAIEDAIWMPNSNRVAVRMTQIGKVDRFEPETNKDKTPAPLRLIAIFEFGPNGKVIRIVKGYDSDVLETGMVNKTQKWREEL